MANEGPIKLDEALNEELKQIKPTSGRGGTLKEVFDKFHKAELSALCFSGGGIRSATFGLGMIQALAKHDLLSKFDYLSTVSGGGYLGCWLSSWIKRIDKGANLTEIDAVQNRLKATTEFANDRPNPEPRQITHLREYSNYMSPKVGLFSADTWTLAAVYLRNLFLNSTVSVPIIAALLLLPRIFLAITNRKHAVSEWLSFDDLVIYALPFSAILGSLSLGFVMKKRPSKVYDAEKEKYSTDIWVVFSGIMPLIVGAFVATTFWYWYTSTKKTFFSSSLLNEDGSYNVYFFILYSLIMYLLGNLFFAIARLYDNGNKWTWKEVAFVLLETLFGASVSVIGAFLIWLTAKNLNASLFSGDGRLYTLLAVPVFLLLFLIAATCFVGFTSKLFIKDPDREWLARFGAWILIFCLAWIVLNGLVLYSKDAANWLWERIILGGWSFESITAKISVLIPIISGAISLVGGFSEKSKVREDTIRDPLSRALRFAPIAGVIFLGCLFAALSLISEEVLRLCQPFFGSKLSFLSSVKGDGIYSIRYLSLWLLLLFAIGALMGGFVNINKFSLHSTYRNRLIRAYLGASRATRKANHFTGFDDNDNLMLKDLKGQKPFHIINGTVNLVSSANLAWQNRKAASFSMTALHCGSPCLGYRKTERYGMNSVTGKSIRLGTAMAISGAAANPNMGYISSPILTFVMTLFNIRLGWWLGNTGLAGEGVDLIGREKKYYEKSSPTMSPLPLLNELLGRTDENKRYINLSDGGHFENLGIYEPIIRRCKFIVLSDAAADCHYKFSEISNAIEKCQVDLGVRIVFNDGLKLYSRADAEENKADRKRFAIADILYPEKDENGNHIKGTLLYIRPSFYGSEPTNVMHYAADNLTFPHQSTGDQQYNENQFEAYRELGFYIMNRLIEKQNYNGLANIFNSI